MSTCEELEENRNLYHQNTIGRIILIPDYINPGIHKQIKEQEEKGFTPQKVH